jgi:aspartate ammonia-lyase
MSKQQTAVEWLINELQKTRDGQRVINEANQSSTSVRDVIKEAKEMEKEQIKSAFNIGELMAHDYFYGNDECAENYYEQTYKGGNK